MPKLKEKIIEKLTVMDNAYGDQEGRRGQLEGEKTRLRLKMQNEQIKTQKKRQLDEMI
jgi:hypothetical protein